MTTWQNSDDANDQPAVSILGALADRGFPVYMGESRLLAMVQSLDTQIAHEYQMLRNSASADVERVATKKLRLVALLEALRVWRAIFSKIDGEIETLQKQRGYWLEKGGMQSVDSSKPSTAPDDWLDRDDETQSWKLSAQVEATLHSDVRNVNAALTEVRTRAFFAGSHRRAALTARDALASRLEILGIACSNARTEWEQAQTSSAENAKRMREAAEAAAAAIAQVTSVASTQLRELPALEQPWTSSIWESWTPDQSGPKLRVGLGGSFLLDSILGTNIRIPWPAPLHANWLISHGERNRGDAHGLVRSLTLRLLTSERPGELRLCVFDPVGLGQSVGDILDLAEYDPGLISGKVWTSTEDLDQRLSELANHVELVIQKYLRTTYRTVDDYNDAAGEVAEPYRVLVLFDYPTGMTTESLARLKSIVENGPRCGVFTIIASDKSVKPAHGVNPGIVANAMRSIKIGEEFEVTVGDHHVRATLRPDFLEASNPIAKSVIDRIGRRAVVRADAAISFSKSFELFKELAGRGIRNDLSSAVAHTIVSDPNTWWENDSTKGISAPIGQKGARDAAVLSFDSSEHAGALLVGRPGSGKSTLLHAFIGGLTTLYSPEELSLYLVDFKEGVEFKAYAEEGLPHAKVVAVESDREFGVSVLESLQAEIVQRGELFRDTGGRQASMQSFREASGMTLPRILLVFDEFQVLFARNDKLGMHAADLLESIIRQGRGFGVHVLLGSQSLSGMDALGAHVHRLLPVRILLPATDSDAHQVLGDRNTAGNTLTAAGEGILNVSGGAVAANERFKGSILSETERVMRARIMREKADHAGFSHWPMVFEGNEMARLDSQDSAQFRGDFAAASAFSVRMRVGRPMAVGGVGDLNLGREAGANILAVIRNGDGDGSGNTPCGPAHGLLASAVASAAMSTAMIDIIDFLPVDDGLDTLFEPLLDAGRITLRRRRAFGQLLDRYESEVTDRVNRDDTRANIWILFLFGVHRARELDDDPSSPDADADLLGKLERVMRDGPEVGVHVWLFADNMNGVSRRLTPRMMREIGWRIAGKMNADDSRRFVDSSQASELRENQLLLTHDDRGITTRMIAFGAPSREWLAEVSALSTQGGTRV